MPAFLVAAAARPSASRYADVHPTDALGARRYEEGGRTPRATVVEDQHLRSGGRQGRRQAGTPASIRPTRMARAATKRGDARLASSWWKGNILRSGGRQGRR